VCDNIVHPAHRKQLGLLSLNEPQVFILLRSGDDIFADFEDFKNKLAEVNFLRPADRSNAGIEQILTDAYNFLLLQDMEEDRLFEERGL
jgi:hypothetical protein